MKRKHLAYMVLTLIVLLLWLIIGKNDPYYPGFKDMQYDDSISIDTIQVDSLQLE